MKLDDIWKSSVDKPVTIYRDGGLYDPRSDKIVNTGKIVRLLVEKISDGRYTTKRADGFEYTMCDDDIGWNK